MPRRLLFLAFAVIVAVSTAAMPTDVLADERLVDGDAGWRDARLLQHHECLGPAVPGDKDFRLAVCYGLSGLNACTLG